MTNAAEPKRLYRSTSDKMIAGVCGGLAEYFEVDPTIVRLLAVLIVLFTGGGAILAYFALALIVPKQPDTPKPQNSGTNSRNARKPNDPGTPSGPILDRK